MNFKKIKLIDFIFFLIFIPYNRYTSFLVILLTSYFLVTKNNISNRKKIVYFISLCLLIFSIFFDVFKYDHYLVFLGVLWVLYSNRIAFNINFSELTDIYIFYSIIFLTASVIPSLFLIGTNLYGNFFDPFTFKIGSSVFASNFIANLLLLITLLYKFKHKVNFIIVFSFLSIIGLLLGSRTFQISFIISITYLVYIYFKERKHIYQKLLITILFIFFVFLSIPYFSSTRLFNDEAGNGRLISWTLILEKNTIFDLIHISDPEDFHLSAFHNIFLDSFYLYNVLGLLFSFIYVFLVLRALYLIYKL